MTAGMMFPSAIPFVLSFGRAFAGDRMWPAAAALMLLVYLGVWLVFGLVLFAVSMLVPIPMPSLLVSVVAIGFAVVYAMTPLRRAGAARCAELCRRFEGGRRGAIGEAVSRGGRYGFACVLCTAGVMTAVFVAGMSDLRLMLVGAAAVFLLKVKSWSAIA
jgi:predicted metal-binding membrane protein